jgi:hypothetical protein
VQLRLSGDSTTPRINIVADYYEAEDGKTPPKVTMGFTWAKDAKLDRRRFVLRADDEALTARLLETILVSQGVFAEMSRWEFEKLAKAERVSYEIGKDAFAMTADQLSGVKIFLAAIASLPEKKAELMRKP